MLSKKKLQDLVREIDPNEQLDEDVEEVRLTFRLPPKLNPISLDFLEALF